ncbi:hypothetical protein Tco_0178414 [Tanacetum coccineum]
MEEDTRPTVQHQRRVNPKIHEVIKKEVIKLLDASLNYLISDSPWVSPVHYVPKKGGMTVVTNEDNELIPTSPEVGTLPYRRNANRCFMQCSGHVPTVYGCHLSRHDREDHGSIMDDFLVFGDSFSSCLSHLDKMLQRKGIKVDRAKVDVIAKLPHPTTVRVQGSPLGSTQNKNLPTDTLRKYRKLPCGEFCGERDVVPTKEKILQRCEALLLGRPLPV